MFITNRKNGRFARYNTVAEIKAAIETLIQQGFSAETDLMVVSNPMSHDKGDMTAAEYLRAVG